jgi:hypothetical protein
MKLVVCLSLACLLLQLQPTPHVSVTTTPNVIASGETAKLIWKVEGFERAYIVGEGRVGSEGVKTVRPTQTTDYILLAEGPHGTVSKAIRLEVKGSRGGEDSCQQELSKFKYPATVDRQVKSVIEEVDRVYRLLQNDLRFSVQASQPLHTSNTNIVFLTNCSQRGDLVGTNEKQIGARRISYRLEMSAGKMVADTEHSASTLNSSQSAASDLPKVTYEIRALVDYRRRIESTWRTEDREEIYNNAIQDLQNRIASLTKAD